MPYSVIVRINSRSQWANRREAINLCVKGSNSKSAKKTRTLVVFRFAAGIFTGKLDSNLLANHKVVFLCKVRVLALGAVIFSLLRRKADPWLEPQTEAGRLFLIRRAGTLLNRRREARVRRQQAERTRLQIDEHLEEIMIQSGSSLRVTQRDILC